MALAHFWGFSQPVSQTRRHFFIFLAWVILYTCCLPVFLYLASFMPPWFKRYKKLFFSFLYSAIFLLLSSRNDRLNLETRFRGWKAEGICHLGCIVRCVGEGYIY